MAINVTKTVQRVEISYPLNAAIPAMPESTGSESPSLFVTYFVEVDDPSDSELPITSSKTTSYTKDSDLSDTDAKVQAIAAIIWG